MAAMEVLGQPLILKASKQCGVIESGAERNQEENVWVINQQ